MRSGLALIIGLLLVFAGCERGTDRTSAAPEDRADALNEQRDHYVTSVEAKLAEVESKFDGLDERAAAMEGTTKTNFERSVEQLRAEKTLVEEKLDQLKDMPAESWMTMKSGVEAAMSHLENSYHQISSSHELVK